MKQFFSGSPVSSLSACLCLSIRSIAVKKAIFLEVAIIAIFSFLSSAVAQDYESVEDKFPSGIQVDAFTGELGAGSEQLQLRSLIAEGIELIKHFEGWRASPYNDVARYCTVGYGHLIALRPCSELDLTNFASALTVEQGETLLEEDIKFAKVAVQSLVSVELSDFQYAALVSFVFNIGSTKFQNSTLRRKLNRGDFSSAPREFTRWVRSKGAVVRGLQDRRVCEASLFEGTLMLAGDGTFDRENCGDLGVASPGVDLIDIEVGE